MKTAYAKSVDCPAASLTLKYFQCHAKYCELPVECKACGLTLVSAPHLARSYHHMFPLTIFIEVNIVLVTVYAWHTLPFCAVL
jgi:transcription factor Ssl1